MEASAAAVPYAARAQQNQRLPTVGLLLADDEEYEQRRAAITSALSDLGWIEGRNLRLDVRKPRATPDEIRKHVEALVAAAPEVIVPTR